MLAALAGTPIEAGVLRQGSDQWKIEVEGPAHAGGGPPAHSQPPAHTPRARTERSDTRALPHPQEFGHDEMKLLYQIYKDFLLDAATEDTVLEQWDDIQCGYDTSLHVWRRAYCPVCERAPRRQAGARRAHAARGGASSDTLCGRSAAVLRPLCINTALGRGRVL